MTDGEKYVVSRRKTPDGIMTHYGPGLAQDMHDEVAELTEPIWKELRKWRWKSWDSDFRFD